MGGSVWWMVGVMSLLPIKVNRWTYSNLHTNNQKYSGRRSDILYLEVDDV